MSPKEPEIQKLTESSALIIRQLVKVFNRQVLFQRQPILLTISSKFTVQSCTGNTPEEIVLRSKFKVGMDKTLRRMGFPVPYPALTWPKRSSRHDTFQLMIKTSHLLFVLHLANYLRYKVNRGRILGDRGGSVEDLLDPTQDLPL
jgi:hypothetical protein